MNPRAMIQTLFRTFVPFLVWLPELKNKGVLKADIIGGVTVAMVLIPQSMAYAQLAGLPPYYGLYAAFMPPLIAALFGSSRQLATGPVAVVSLMTAAALEPLATAGSANFVAYAILLSFIVGLFQLALGLLRLGVLVNFLSHPVVVGFTNAAAIIIATSQLGKVFGVTVEKMPHHYETVYNVILAAFEHIHWPTFVMALLAFSIMIFLKRERPKWPNVLIAVTITSIVSLSIDFHQSREITVSNIVSAPLVEDIATYHKLSLALTSVTDKKIAADKRLTEIEKEFGYHAIDSINQRHEVDLLQLSRIQLGSEQRAKFREIESQALVWVTHSNQSTITLVSEAGDQKADIWHISKITKDGNIKVYTGGKIVGHIPEGLPDFQAPTLDWSIISQIILAAITISLIGFMEAISIAKAMAVKTRQRLDANQELIGQGLGNIVGSMFQSYPASGSFSRSAVSIGAGSITGFSSVITVLVVVIVLLWLTPLLYFLPQATLAAVIMMAVFGLINFKAIAHAWHANHNDGAVSAITFVVTLVFAPHLDKGIMIGLGLSILLYLLKTMKPRVVLLARTQDGSLRDVNDFKLKCSEDIALLRFEGSLYFANTSYFEDKVQEVLSRKPSMKFLLVEFVSINHIDATGEEMLDKLVIQLEETGIQVLFIRAKQPIMKTFENTGFIKKHGDQRFFRATREALDYVWDKLGGEAYKKTCPLHTYIAGSGTS